MTNLQSISDTDLKAELQRREESALKAKQEALEKQRQLIVENVDTLLNLIPEHDRTSCNDEDRANARSFRCKRCVLLQIQKDGFMDNLFTIEFYFHKN